MKTSDSHNDDGHGEIRAALRRDAARVKDVPFDAGLHYATMRRIRAGTAEPRLRWGWIATGAATAVALIFGLLAAPWHTAPPPLRATVRGEVPASTTATRVSAWAYQTAADQSDETLLAMLDRDARVLLPETASPFSTPLN